MSANFRPKGALSTNHCWCPKTKVIALSCGIKISAVHYLVLSQSTRVTDRRTDRDYKCIAEKFLWNGAYSEQIGSVLNEYYKTDGQLVDLSGYLIILDTRERIARATSQIGIIRDGKKKD